MKLRLAWMLWGLLGGCASTSGREWLSMPVEERAFSGQSEVVTSEAPASRPRLDRTVTLGESYAAAPADRAEPAPGGVGVQVNVQVQAPVVTSYGYGGYGYGGYGYGGYGRGSASPARAAQRGSSSPPVGGNFPAVPDYGPPAMR